MKETLNLTAVNAAALREQQGLSFDVVSGGSASTKLAIAAMRYEDTLVSVQSLEVSAGSVPALAAVNRVDDFSIVNTRAYGTLTISSTGPANNENVTVNGNTYRFRTTGNALQTALDVRVGATNSETLDNLVAAINLYENRRLGSGWNEPIVKAEKTSATVVTIRAVQEGPGNGITVAASSGGNIAASGTDTHSATLTLSTAVEDDEFDLNGLTFVGKDEPDVGELLQFAIGDDDDETAANIADAINAYVGVYGPGVLDARASSADEVVTIVPFRSRLGNQIEFSNGTASNIADSPSSGKLSNGTNTGGIVSAQDTTGETLMVVWLNKNP